MKIKLLAISLISLLVVNAQASSLREIAAQNPGASAVAGYVVGSLAYKQFSTGSLDPRFNNGFIKGIDTLGFGVAVRNSNGSSMDITGITASRDNLSASLCVNHTTAFIWSHNKEIVAGLVASAALYGLSILAAKK